VPETVTASVAIPTRRRPAYLDVALRSIMPQAAGVGAEVIVVSDGPEKATAEVARRHDAAIVSLPAPAGLNAARNAAVAHASGDLIVFVDDDVEVLAGWLHALLDGAAANPGTDVFGGPIQARLEGGGPRGCGREKPPITTLDLGGDDHDVSRVWGSNMAVRPRALRLVGPFDESIIGTGDEEEWLQRYRAAGGRIRYLAGAAVAHRRSPRDARIVNLSKAAYVRGRSARRYDARSGTAPPIRRELRTLAGCGWHTLRRRCGLGIVAAALSAGRLREALADRRP